MPALLLPGALLTAPVGARAQDVEWLGQVFGRQVPEGYYRTMARDPEAFRFRRGVRPERGPGRRVGPDRPGARRASLPFGGLPLEGVVRVPVILGLYADAPEPLVPAETLEREFFMGPSSRHQTVREYYAAESRGRVDLQATVFPWVRVDLTAAEVAGDAAGLDETGKVGEFIHRILARLDDGSVDWGQFDNDGPDGVPNSGDDDGYVDAVTVMHPTAGGECNPNPTAVWSHRWTLSDNSGRPFTTRSPSAAGGTILIDDYTIQPSLDCAGKGVNFIGVYAHELGHAFGLPDLYAVGGDHAGIGFWGLMAWGGTGCRGENAGVPCNLSAWSLEQLGWAEVERVPPGADRAIVLPPVETSARVVRIDAADGSGDYFLLENRQGVGTPRQLSGHGLLVWRIDQERLDEAWEGNRVNTFPDRMGVRLMEADGIGHLARARQGAGGTGGDPGDPFPGSTGRRAFHAGDEPLSQSHLGSAAGVTIVDITEVGADVSFRALQGFRTVRVVLDGAEGARIDLNGRPQTPPVFSFSTAPFERHLLEAQRGIPLAPGVRNGFVAWEDGSERVRRFQAGLGDSLLVARYGREELRVEVALEGPPALVAPGAVTVVPGTDDGWVPRGAAVEVVAEPATGFAFTEWTGALAGAPNPARVTVDAPVEATARFEQAFRFTESSSEVTLRAALSGRWEAPLVSFNAPVELTVVAGRLPDGMAVRPSAARIDGVPLEEGVFPVTVRARDAVGLEAAAEVTLRVLAPELLPRDLARSMAPGERLPDDLVRFLDRNGNGNGTLDVGDFRWFLMSRGGAASAAAGAGLRAPGD
ncbi:MAG: M6 family metalloprotease domain-containing protein, partial [Gemmatimonadetes bacterium]